MIPFFTYTIIQLPSQEAPPVDPGGAPTLSEPNSEAGLPQPPWCSCRCNVVPPLGQRAPLYTGTALL